MIAWNRRAKKEHIFRYSEVFATLFHVTLFKDDDLNEAPQYRLYH